MESLRIRLTCPECRTTPANVEYEEKDGDIVCTDCGLVLGTIYDNHRPCYDDYICNNSEKDSGRRGDEDGEDDEGDEDDENEEEGNEENNPQHDTNILPAARTGVLDTRPTDQMEPVVPRVEYSESDFSPSGSEVNWDWRADNFKYFDEERIAKLWRKNPLNSKNDKPSIVEEEELPPPDDRDPSALDGQEPSAPKDEQEEEPPAPKYNQSLTLKERSPTLDDEESPNSGEELFSILNDDKSPISRKDKSSAPEDYELTSLDGLKDTILEPETALTSENSDSATAEGGLDEPPVVIDKFSELLTLETEPIVSTP